MAGTDNLRERKTQADREVLARKELRTTIGTWAGIGVVAVGLWAGVHAYDAHRAHVRAEQVQHSEQVSNQKCLAGPHFITNADSGYGAGLCMPTGTVPLEPYVNDKGQLVTPNDSQEFAPNQNQCPNGVGPEYVGTPCFAPPN